MYGRVGLPDDIEYADSATTVITFYATSLGACAGQAYCAPSLPIFAQRWLEGTREYAPVSKEAMLIIWVRS